jgi:hypothetical protein
VVVTAGKQLDAVGREVDVAKLGGGFRWLTPLFSRALYKPKEKHLLTGRRLQQLVSGDCAAL